VSSDPDVELKDLLRKFCICRLKVAIAERKMAELKAKPKFARIDETHLLLLEREFDDARRLCAEALDKVNW